MTDNRPEPKYGQYAPIPPVSPEAAAVVASVAPAQANVGASATRRAWDTAMTTLLLLLGVVDVVRNFSTFANLPDRLRAAYATLGYPPFTSDAIAATMGLGLNIARITILAITIVVSLLLIRAGKTAIWAPLAGAALAGIVVTVGLMVVMAQDPALAEYLQRTTTP